MKSGDRKRIDSIDEVKAPHGGTQRPLMNLRTEAKPIRDDDAC